MLLRLPGQVVTPGEPTPTIPTVRTRRPAGMSFYLTLADGSTWDISRGPVQLKRNVRGLVPGDVEHTWQSLTGMPGGSHRGFGVGVGSVMLPLEVRAAEGLPWRDLDAMFWHGLRPDTEVMWSAVTPDGRVRSMLLWFVGVGDYEFESDPLTTGRAVYPCGFDVADPLWRGDKVVQEFSIDPNPPNAFDPHGGVINLIPENSTANATIRNDGDEPAWPVYAVTGPMESFSLGVGDATLDYGDVPVGTTVWVDTHPTRRTVGFAEGENDEAAWLNLAARKFVAIPAGAEVPINVDLMLASTGAGLRVEVTPRHRRPW